jgi:hypothetical protein
MRHRTQAVDSSEQPVGVPRTGNGAVRRAPPARATNASVRNREHLTQGEVERLIGIARAGCAGTGMEIVLAAEVPTRTIADSPADSGPDSLDRKRESLVG